MILFLDIDGVLTFTGTIDPKRVALLNEIPGMEVVISSAWRAKGLEKVTKALQEAGLIAPVIGATPMLPIDRTGWDEVCFVSVSELSLHRRKEIDHWLKKHPEIKQYVILDDLPIPGKNVVCVGHGGLKKRHIEVIKARYGE